MEHRLAETIERDYAGAPADYVEQVKAMAADAMRVTVTEDDDWLCAANLRTIEWASGSPGRVEAATATADGTLRVLFEPDDMGWRVVWFWRLDADELRGSPLAEWCMRSIVKRFMRGLAELGGW